MVPSWHILSSLVLFVVGAKQHRNCENEPALDIVLNLRSLAYQHINITLLS